jgi:hypothetical protein
MSPPPVAVAYLVTQDNLGRPAVLPDGLVIGPQDVTFTTGSWPTAAEMVGEGRGRALLCGIGNGQ